MYLSLRIEQKVQKLIKCNSIYCRSILWLSTHEVYLKYENTKQLSLVLGQLKKEKTIF